MPDTPLQVASNDKPKKPWYLHKYLICFVSGFVVALALIVAVHIIRDHMASESKLSCHQPTTQDTQLPYCVYYKNHKLLIGASNNRGITYTIPYNVEDISVSWENDTDAVTITMPGTKLVVQASEYVDQR